MNHKQNVFFALSVQCLPDIAEYLQMVCFENECMGIYEITMTEDYSLPSSFIAYFQSELNMLQSDEKIGQIKSSSPEYQIETQHEIVKDQNWKTAWHSYFVPRTIASTFLVHPPWHNPDESCLINICIRPGQAFGTGYHETTSLCLSVLSTLDVDDKILLDVGTGSGILAIAALKLGARRVFACDIDPVCTEEVRTNCKHNHFADSLGFYIGGAPSIKNSAVDVVIANLDYPTLKSVATDLKRIVKPGGTLVCSGILQNQSAEIINLLKMEKDDPAKLVFEGEWAAVIFKQQ